MRSGRRCTPRALEAPDLSETAPLGHNRRREMAEKTKKKQVLLRKRAPEIVKSHRWARNIRRAEGLRAATVYLNGVHGLVQAQAGRAPQVDELIAARQPAEPVRHGIPRLYLSGLSDLNFTINGQCAGRDEHVASRWTIRATHSGELLGVPPTGRELQITGVTVNAVEGELVKLEGFTNPAGKPVEEQWAFWVVEEWNYWDLPGLAALIRNGQRTAGGTG
jgi:SnoaL-like polyketide cyclase